MDDSPDFKALRYLLNEYQYIEMNIFIDNRVFFKKGNLPPIEVNAMKIGYTKLELSSYAIQVCEIESKFIERFEWVIETIKKLSNKG